MAKEIMNHLSIENIDKLIIDEPDITIKEYVELLMEIEAIMKSLNQQIKS